jgi:hypothetical protein
MRHTFCSAVYAQQSFRKHAGEILASDEQLEKVTENGGTDVLV